MIKSWNKFNENNYPWSDEGDKMAQKNIEPLTNIFSDIRDCFLSLEDDNAIEYYSFSGFWNNDIDNDPDKEILRPSQGYKILPKEGEGELIEKASKFYVPKIGGGFKSKFFEIGIKMPNGSVNANGSVNSNGLSILEQISEASDRLKKYIKSPDDIELIFWGFKFIPSQRRSMNKPFLEVRIFFELDCDWDKQYLNGIFKDTDVKF